MKIPKWMTLELVVEVVAAVIAVVVAHQPKSKSVMR
jgi:hypothetical protein